MLQILETNCTPSFFAAKRDPPTPRGTWGNFGETSGGVGKLMFWRTKAAISLKRVKTEEKLLWTVFRKSPTLLRTVPSPTPMASPSSRLGVCNLATLTPLISGTGKATDFKFGGYIYMAIPNRGPLKILEKMERGHIQGLPKFFGYPYYLRNG